MIINHIVQRREERRQRKARWMLSRCFTQEVQITDIIIQVPSTSSMSLDMEEPIVIPDVIIEEPIVMEEPIIIVVEPIVMQEKAIISTKHVDEASEELRKLLILHQTIKKLSSKKKVI